MPFQPEQILRVLAERQVDFVIIGGLAAALLGSSYVTRDLDIVYQRAEENRDRLALALQLLQARSLDDAIGTEGITADYLDDDGMFAFDTPHGRLDCFGSLPDGPPYEAVRSRAEEQDLGAFPVAVCQLDDLIDMKRAADRPKDRALLPELEALRRLREGMPP